MVPPSRRLSATRSYLGLSRLQFPRFLAPFPNSTPRLAGNLSPMPDTEAPQSRCAELPGRRLGRPRRLARSVRLRALPSVNQRLLPHAPVEGLDAASSSVNKMLAEAEKEGGRGRKRAWKW